jgi:hypothetical protein
MANTTNNRSMTGTLQNIISEVQELIRLGIPPGQGGGTRRIVQGGEV